MFQTPSKKLQKLIYPNGRTGIIYNIFLIVLIVASAVHFAISERHFLWEPAKPFVGFFEIFVIVFFSIDYVIRIVCIRPLKGYIFSAGGAIDFLSSIPSMIFLIFGAQTGFDWIRVLRIARLARAFKLTRDTSYLFGVTGKAAPYVLMVLSIKAVIVAFEEREWWPHFDGIGTAIGVVGFTVAVVLGAKLTILNNRLYAIEDAVCRIVGSLRDMNADAQLSKKILDWSRSLERALKTPQNQRRETAFNMRMRTDRLEAEMEKAGISGPNSAGFHRDVAFVLHRMNSKTPEVYNNFLKVTLAIYVCVIIFSIPGWTGFVMSGVISFALVGVFFLVDDLDDPLNPNGGSFIDADLDALEFFNRDRS